MSPSSGENTRPCTCPHGHVRHNEPEPSPQPQPTGPQRPNVSQLDPGSQCRNRMAYQSGYQIYGMPAMPLQLTVNFPPGFQYPVSWSSQPMLSPPMYFNASPCQPQGRTLPHTQQPRPTMKSSATDGQRTVAAQKSQAGETHPGGERPVARTDSISPEREPEREPEAEAEPALTRPHKRAHNEFISMTPQSFNKNRNSQAERGARLENVDQMTH